MEDLNKINRQVRIIGKYRNQLKRDDCEYIPVKTEFGIIMIPKKFIIKSLSSSIEHFKSIRQTIETKN